MANCLLDSLLIFIMEIAGPLRVDSKKGYEMIRNFHLDKNAPRNTTNILEKGTPDWKFEGFHIHKATQRYQELGIQEEGFAEKTNKYTDWKGALKCAMSENNCTIEVAPNQKRL